jgi:hypothetical protein
MQTMAPNSNTNLIPKRPVRTARRTTESGINFSPPPIQTSVPPVRIVGARTRYRGGYHLSGV